MSLIFYPHEDDLDTSGIADRIEVLMEAAERFKAIVLDAATKPAEQNSKRLSPRDLTASYNWEEISRLLREIRDLPESTSTTKLTKSDHLIKLAEIYEVLRAAKMPKLEAVRLALTNESNELKAGGGSQVA
jgi:hypothetical protein